MWLNSSYFNNLRNKYQANRDYFYNQLTNLGMKVFKTEGAYYMFANISRFDRDDVEFADFLVKDEGVAVVPGSSFYNGNYNNKNPGSDYVRFLISQKLETLKQAIKRIKRRLI